MAARCEGSLTTQELHECGLSDEQVRTRVRQCTLFRIHQGVYAVGHPGLSPMGLCVAAVKACGPNAALGFSSALAVIGLWRWQEGLPPEVVVQGTSRPERQGIRIHRTSSLPAADVRRIGCIRVTTTARAIADLAARLTDQQTLQLVREAQGAGLVKHRQLLEVQRRLGRRPGSGRLALAIAQGPAPTRSVLESTVLDLILDAGFEHPDVNVPLLIDGRRVVPDFRWPAQRLIVEADGAAWHSGPAASAADLERQRLLEASGERVERVTWDEAVTQRRGFVRRLDRAGAPRVA